MANKQAWWKSSWLWMGVILLGFWLGRKWYHTPSYGSADKAPNFVGYLPDGDSIQLSDFEGKIVLLDFWGSWCGPCRRDNPNLVELHQKYQEKGFEIVSVGIESRKRSWLAAIQNDNLYWKYHVSDLKQFDDHVAELYGVRKIPTTFLINQKGEIEGVDWSKGDIKNYLDKHLK